MNSLDTEVVKLNKSWCAVDILSAKEAIVFLCSEHNGEPPGYAMDYERVIDEQGNRHLLYANPVSWEDWIKLPVRETDRFILTSRGRIRLPLIVICAHYNKVPMRNTRWSTGNVHKRDDYVCAYTRRKLSRARATVDHILPRSRGGRDSWENTVTCDREINVMKGSRTPEEAGLTLHRKPKAPPAMMVVIRKTNAPHPDQALFLME